MLRMTFVLTWWVTTLTCLSLIFVMSNTNLLKSVDTSPVPSPTSGEIEITPATSQCPVVKRMADFNIFAMLGQWFVVLYYSSSEEILTYHCMRVEFGLSGGNMDMRMQITYRYANDPEDELQTGNMTWEIPDPTRPEHWRHTEDHYRGIYNTDVIDTDYSSWLLLLHCSDPEPNKRFLSTFVLSRRPLLDKLTLDYLREKISHYSIELEYLFPVNQTLCLSDSELTSLKLLDSHNLSIPFLKEGQERMDGDELEEDGDDDDRPDMTDIGGNEVQKKTLQVEDEDL